MCPSPPCSAGQPGAIRLCREAGRHSDGAQCQARPDRRREARSIKTGLQVGEQVVIDGTDRLRDGAKIRQPGATRARRRAAGRRAARCRGARSRHQARRVHQGAPRQRQRSAATAEAPAGPPRLTSNPGTRHEPVAPFHSAAGRHHAADGGDHAGGRCRLSLPAALGAAGGRLPDHPGADASIPAPAPR